MWNHAIFNAEHRLYLLYSSPHSSLLLLLSFQFVLLLSHHCSLRQSSGMGNMGSKAVNHSKSLTETPDKKKKQGVEEHAQPPNTTHLTSLSITSLTLQAGVVEEGVIWLHRYWVLIPSKLHSAAIWNLCYHFFFFFSKTLSFQRWSEADPKRVATQ